MNRSKIIFGGITTFTVGFFSGGLITKSIIQYMLNNRLELLKNSLGSIVQKLVDREFESEERLIFRLEEELKFMTLAINTQNGK